MFRKDRRPVGCKNPFSFTLPVTITMRTFDRARALLSRDPHGPSVRVLQKLLHALETGGDFNLAELAILPHDRYQLAVEVLRDWRSDCYHVPGFSAARAGQARPPAAAERPASEALPA